MKNTLLVLLSLIMIVFSSSAFAKKVEKLPVERDGLYYEPFSTNIANGQYEIYHKNGQMNTTMTFKDGLYDGPYERYYKNGQLRYRGTFKDGIKDGFSELYYKNGQLWEKLHYKDGKENGPSEIYHENGQINKERQYGLYESNIYPGTLSSRCFYFNGEMYEC
jgi:antitoxin component YwqK of YwqJK toxin-antitoxin module